MGTPHKEENTTETSVSDYNMEIKKDEKCIHEENSPTNEDPMVNSSESSLLQDASIVNSCFNNSVSDSSLLNECQSDENRLPNDEDSNEPENATPDIKTDEEKSNISESSAYTKYCEGILNKNSSMSVEALPILSDDNSKNTVLSMESNDGENESTSVQDASNTVIALSQDVGVDMNAQIIDEIVGENGKNVDIDSESVIEDEKLKSKISGEIMELGKETELHPNVSNNNEVKPSAETPEKSESVTEETIMENDKKSDSDIICDDLKAEMGNQLNDKDVQLPIIETPQKSTPSKSVEKEIFKRKATENDSNAVCKKLDADMSGNLSVDQDSLGSESPNSKQKFHSSEKESADKTKKSSRVRKSKKCPKIKISVMKDPNAGSPNSLKNWFISESKKSDESRKSSRGKVLATSSKSNDNSEKSPNAHPLTKISSSLSDVDDKVDSKDLVSNKLDSTSLDENQLASSNITSPIDKVKSSLVENSLADCDETLHSKACFVDLEKLGSVKIKEEPMDFEENLEPLENTEVNSKKQTKSVRVAKVVNTPGRTRKSKRFSVEVDTKGESSQTNVSSKESKKALKVIKTSAKETTVSKTPAKETTVSKTPAKETTVSKTPAKETTVSTTPHSGDRKKKSISGSTSTTPVTSGRKKHFNPELVRVPFAMGWMREHVIRAPGKDGKRQSDIYYFAPDGGKLRSMPEISNYLSKHLEIKLTTVNFTFAKELLYREPFEIERDAKHPSKLVTPNHKASVKTPLSSNKNNPPKKRLCTPTTLEVKNEKDKSASKNTTSSLSLKNKVSRQRRSSFKQTVSKKISKNTPSSNSKNSKSAKLATLDSYLNTENEKTAAMASSRPSRKIVKKVPFDNSFENMFPKTPKLTEKRNSSGKLKINTKTETINIKTETIDDFSDSSGTKPKESDVLSVAKENGHVLDSNLSSVTKSSELCVDKPVSASSSVNVTEESLLERTNIKSPTVKNKLKVKFATGRKPDVVLHNPCNKYCNFASVRQPSVKCCVCLCLFHPECIPFKNDGGLTKYACVPCVKTQLNLLDEEIPPDMVFPSDFNLELLYPQIDLQIRINNKFNKNFNKFFSPVDPSFVHSLMSDNVHIAPSNKTYSAIYPCSVPACGIVDTNNFNSSSQCSLLQTSNLPDPVSFNVPNMLHKGYPAIPATVPFPRTLVNNSNINMGNCGNLPLLQNFSDSYFVQNQPCNKTILPQPQNFQNPFYQRPRYNNSLVGQTLNVSNSKAKNPVIVQKLIKHPQNSNLSADKYFIVSKNTSNCQSGPGSSTSNSVLQSLLQSGKIPHTQAIRSANVSQLSAEKFQQINLNDYLILIKNNTATRFSSPTTAVPKQVSLLPASSSLQSNNNEKARNLNDTIEKPSKRMKCDQSIETENSGVSELIQNNSEDNSSNLDHFSTFWSCDKFSQIYECLNLIFKYLNVSDLLSASLVCRSWNRLASQKLLWEYACFSKSFVKNWGKCSRTLKRYKTRCIDFRGIHNQDSENEWKSFVKYLNNLTEVEELIFEKVPPFVINEIADALPQLKRLTCYCLASVFTEPEIWSTPCEFKLATLRCLGRLEALKISSMGGINLDSSPQSLMPYLPKLTHVVLTGFKFNCFMNLECLSMQKELITLELGDCADMEPQLYGLLTKLTNLENLCLQNGGIIDDTKLPEALSNMSKLKTLELMNFRISSHLPDVLKKMDTLHHFSLWPDSTTEPAQVNFNSFSAATSCTNLKSLCWGILTDDDDDAVPNALELQDGTKSEIKKLSFEELFQSLVKHYPGVKVEVKCLPRSIWSEFCSSRNFV